MRVSVLLLVPCLFALAFALNQLKDNNCIICIGRLSLDENDYQGLNFINDLTNHELVSRNVNVSLGWANKLVSQYSTQMNQFMNSGGGAVALGYATQIDATAKACNQIIKKNSKKDINVLHKVGTQVNGKIRALFKKLKATNVYKKFSKAQKKLQQIFIGGGAVQLLNEISSPRVLSMKENQGHEIQQNAKKINTLLITGGLTQYLKQLSMTIQVMPKNQKLYFVCFVSCNDRLQHWFLKF